MRSLKNKLLDNKAMITKADKGNSIVVVDQDAYQEKVLRFIKENNFTNLINDPTNKFQKEIREVVNDCQQLIRKKKFYLR
jgi:hypothetical protein